MWRQVTEKMWRRSRNDVIVAVVFILHSISQSQKPSLIFFFCFFSHRSHLGPELLPFPWLLVQWCYTNNMSTEVCFNNIIFPPYLSSMSMTTYLFNFSLFILPKIISFLYWNLHKLFPYNNYLLNFLSFFFIIIFKIWI